MSYLWYWQNTMLIMSCSFITVYTMCTLSCIATLPSHHSFKHIHEAARDTAYRKEHGWAIQHPWGWLQAESTLLSTYTHMPSTATTRVHLVSVLDLKHQTQIAYSNYAFAPCFLYYPMTPFHHNIHLQDILDSIHIAIHCISLGIDHCPLFISRTPYWSLLLISMKYFYA